MYRLYAVVMAFPSPLARHKLLVPVPDHLVPYLPFSSLLGLSG